MKNDIPDEKIFYVYGDNALQMFVWLSPYIEKSGYKHTTEEVKDEFGELKIGIRKITISK